MGVSEAGVPGTRFLRDGVEEREPTGEIPERSEGSQKKRNLRKLVRPERFELPTYSSGGCRSIQTELRARREHSEFTSSRGGHQTSYQSRRLTIGHRPYETEQLNLFSSR